METTVNPECTSTTTTSPNAPIIISIDGNIGSGKSVTLEKFKEFCMENGLNDYCFVQEPVNEWLNVLDKDGVHILENLYKNTAKFAFRFQMMAYISRLALLKKAIKNPNNRVIITERSISTDRMVFAKMLYDAGDIEEDEYTIYNMWFHEFVEDMPISGIVYVRASPDVCIHRIGIRSRQGETIQSEYIERCHKYHDDWLEKETCEKLRLDADGDAGNDPDLFANRMKEIHQFIEHIALSKSS